MRKTKQGSIFWGFFIFSLCLCLISCNQESPLSNTVSHTAAPCLETIEYEKQEESYILNKKSKKIHKITCGTAALILPENREDYSGSRETLFSLGYTHCGNCFR